MNEPTPPEGRPSDNGGSSDADFEEFHGVLLYRGSIPFDQLPFPAPPPEETEAWEWVNHDPEINRLYGGLVVAVHQRKVWGVGKTDRAAREDTLKKPGCPPEDELVFVTVAGLPPSQQGADGGNRPA
jgi:hypothetical protein